jgi:NADH dehydrogenase
MAAATDQRPRVLVLGGGFGGIGAVRKLKDAAVDVVLVDQHDYHTFQPLLYQVASDLLETSTVGHPLRGLFHDQPNVTVHQGTVTGIDLEQRQAAFAELDPVSYEYVVLALGAGVNFFGTEGAEHAFPMYTLADAERLRKHILAKWQAADRNPSLLDDGVLNVVVVGGGATGVETAGALAELYRNVLAKDYRGVPQEQARITIVEAAPELFMMFKPDIRSYTTKTLEKRGVDVRTGELVASIAPTGVTLKSGAALPAHTVIWGAGLQASPIAESLGLELQKGSRVAVGLDLSLPGHPEAFVVGDVAWITDATTGEVLPQLGSVALQAGERAGENIERLEAGKATEPFEYKDKGTMATIGPGAAVVQLRKGRTIKGKAAFLAWGAVHLALLSTGEDRAKAVVDWTWAGLTRERSSRISVDTNRGDNGDG